MACSTGMTAVLCKYNDYKCQKKGQGIVFVNIIFIIGLQQK